MMLNKKVFETTNERIKLMVLVKFQSNVHALPGYYIPGGGDDGENRRCWQSRLYPGSGNAAGQPWRPRAELGGWGGMLLSPENE